MFLKTPRSWAAVAALTLAGTTGTFLATAPMAYAQTDSSTLTGTIVDTSGAAIPTAGVVVKNTATGFTRSARANRSGVYTFAGLPIGTYTVTVTAPSFGSYVTNVNLTVGSETTTDAKLGATAVQSVTADASAQSAQVDLSDSQVSTTITPHEMIDLPSLTRNPYDFVVLSGATASDPNGSTSRGVGVALNGQRAAGTEILLDGVENADTYDATVGQTIPLDAVEEYNVIINGFDAQYGRASGGVVNLATRSGANQFHGSAYEYNRVSDLASNTYAEDAANYENRASGGTNNRPDHFTRNQFGYSIGGRIIKDKLFFFNNYEWNRIRSSGATQFAVPEAATIAASAANTQAFFAQYGKYAPGVTLGGDLGNGFQTATLIAPVNSGAGSPVNSYFGDSRVDFTLNNKVSMFFRVATYNDTFEQGSNSLSPYAGYDTGQSDADQSYLFSLNYVINQNFLSSSKVSYARLKTDQPLGANGVVPSLYLTEIGGTIGGTPVALPGYLPTSPGNALPFGGPQNLYQFVQDLSYIKGKHTIKFGGSFIQIRDNRTFGAYESAVESFATTTSVAKGVANFATGTIGSFEVAVNPQGKLPCAYNEDNTLNVTTGCSITLPAASPRFERENTFNDGNWYVEDQFKVTPRLTLNYGIRWEYYGVQHNHDPNLESNFFLGAGSNLAEQVQTGQMKTTPNSPVGGLIAKDLTNYAPRVGFALDVFGDGKTALRGGYGITYERDFGNVTYNVIQNPPNYAGVVVNNTPLTNSNFGPFSAASGTVPLHPPSVRALQQNMPTAYTHQFSLTLEHNVSRNDLISATYTGAIGVHLYAIANVNDYGSGTFVGYPDTSDSTTSCGFFASYCNDRINPQYGGINLREANGHSSYNALNVKYQVNDFSKLGLQFVANYTYSHSLDQLSSTFSESAANFNLGYTNAYNPSLDYGNSDFDIRNQLSVGGIYQPTFLEFKSSRIAHTLFGGLEFAPIATIHSGNAFTIYDCTYAYSTCPRINKVAGLQFHGTSPNTQGFDGSPADFQYVNLPSTAGNQFTNSEGISGFPDTLGGYQNIGMDRNQFFAPMNVSFDAGVYKNFAFGAGERYKLQLRSEFYNVLNHSNYYPIVGSSDFAEVSNVGVAKGSPGGSPSASDERRNVQLAVRLQF